MRDHDMEDNYLWDRSGEPDPQVQELETILSTLRYQPRPLEIPQHIRPGHRRSFFPALAIAAAIALFAVLLGLWFSFSRRQAPSLQATGEKPIQQRTVTPQPEIKPDNASSPTVVQNPEQKIIQKRSDSPRILRAGYKTRAPGTLIRQPQLTAQELAEKEQVLVALRLVSAKLNLAQRRAQGVPQLNTIRNQHKIG
jgi:hypothetical protein